MLQRHTIRILICWPSGRLRWIVVVAAVLRAGRGYVWTTDSAAIASRRIRQAIIPHSVQSRDLSRLLLDGHPETFSRTGELEIIINEVIGCLP